MTDYYTYDQHVSSGAPGARFYVRAVTTAPGGAVLSDAPGTAAPIRPAVNGDAGAALDGSTVRQHLMSHVLPQVIAKDAWLYWRPLDGSGQPTGTAALVPGRGVTGSTVAALLGQGVTNYDPW